MRKKKLPHIRYTLSSSAKENLANRLINQARRANNTGSAEEAHAICLRVFRLYGFKYDGMSEFLYEALIKEKAFAFFNQGLYGHAGVHFYGIADVTNDLDTFLEAFLGYALSSLHENDFDLVGDLCKSDLLRLASPKSWVHSLSYFLLGLAAAAKGKEHMWDALAYLTLALDTVEKPPLFSNSCQQYLLYLLHFNISKVNYCLSYYDEAFAEKSIVHARKALMAALLLKLYSEAACVNEHLADLYSTLNLANLAQRCVLDAQEFWSMEPSNYDFLDQRIIKYLAKVPFEWLLKSDSALPVTDALGYTTEDDGYSFEESD